MARIQGLDKVVHDQDHILILGSIASVESWKKQELLYGTAVQLVYVKAVVMQVLRKLYQMIFRVS